MGRRNYRDRFPGDIYTEGQAGLVNGREPLFDKVAVLVTDVKVNAVVTAGLHFSVNCPGNSVAGSKVAPAVILLHEMQVFFINQPAAFAADRLRNKEIFCFRVVEACRMKLNKLEISDIGAGPVGHGNSVPRSNVRVCCIKVYLAAAAGTENSHLGAPIINGAAFSV